MTTQEKTLLNGPLSDYLLTLGVTDVEHTNGKFLPHLKGLAKYLERYNRPFSTIVAGLFHSIYGTENFNGFSISLERRGEVREKIGAEAEALVYAYCRMSQQSFDRSVLENTPYFLLDRELLTNLPVTPKQFVELQWMMLLDTLEVDQRVSREEQWESRIPFWFIVADRLGEDARTALRKVYGIENNIL
ncbi:MAG: DUF6817 domain-containing protein [Candidatus Paceibacterota bacterium]